ncbi:MAG TPA: protein kinase [Candidatus Cybelea sp.]|nr:protein kinase [Candidatus Cybelea sp.]
MVLTSGDRLGPYEILGPLGVGGMGEVYRAHDSKLGREVALKVLPEAFSRDAERMARFEREAKILASLNHPNIASIYGLEDSGSTHALVMELVEGSTLAERIRSGAFPIDETLRIARQIAEALEYAHERGIVHRDLKPANVKVTGDDAVKILDFGLAKAIEGDSASADMGDSPTLSRMATQAGVLMGTAAYMSPEQAKGKAVDRRADIWAFGCVLFEMLTRKMAFCGDTATDTIASVIKDEPDWSQLPPTTPVRVRVLVERCLQKDAKQRLRDIGDARISLDEVLSGSPESSPVAVAPVDALSWRRALPWAVAALLLVSLGPIAFVHLREQPPAPREVSRFQIPVPDKTALAIDGAFAVSPDGRQLAFAATGPDGVLRLWIRSRDSIGARPLTGADLPPTPRPFFWSPDSRYIGFDAGGKLKKIDVSGGPARTLCDISGLALGGSWNRDGVILFGNDTGGLMRVSADSGPAVPLTILDPARGESNHAFPSFLPDGRHFIYLRRSGKPGNTGAYVGSLDAKPEEQSLKLLLSTAYGPVFAPSSDPGSDRLLFLRDGALMTQLFDPRKLELRGEPDTVTDRIGFFYSFGFFSASTNGVLVYRTGVGGASRLTLFDRQGNVRGAGGEQGNYYGLALSPDGTRAAVSRIEQNGSLWLVDLSRGTSSRFTLDDSDAVFGTWSPDGSRVIFASSRSGVYDLYQKQASDVNGEELVLKSSDSKYPTSWSRDGRFLLYMVLDPATAKYALSVLPFEGDRKPFPFLRTEFNNYDGQFSPDGRRVAYVSDESGREEVYVRTFSPDPAETVPDLGGKWLISTGGGSQPRWRGDGKELYYLAPDLKLMAVEITTNPSFRAGVPKPLFQAPQLNAVSIVSHSWDLTPDGKLFLFAAPADQGSAPFDVLLNWQAALKD